MKIHIVCDSDTIYSVSKQYGVPEIRILTDNFLNPTSKLTPGQALIINYPTKTYSVRGGDTLETIAQKNNISVLSLLQNNPRILENGIIPSQTINILYDKEKARQIAVAAYTGNAQLEKIETFLPNVSILSVQNNAFISGSNISVSNAALEYSEIAKVYRSLPILVIDCVNERGKFDGNCISDVLNSPSETENLINNILNAVENNGYAGVELNSAGIKSSDKYKFCEMFLALFSKCKDRKLQCVCPMIPIEGFDSVDDNLMDITDYIPLWSYVWNENSAISNPSPVHKSESLLREDVLSKYFKKLLLGIPLFGVDFAKTGASYKKSIVDPFSFCNNLKNTSTYQYKRISDSTFIEYVEKDRKNGTQHTLCLEDALSISKKLDLLDRYGLYGVNVMSLEYCSPALWQILNQRYKILKF